MLADTVTEFHVVLAIHVATIVVAFGAIFAHPIVFALARRGDPRSLPVLHRIEYTIERWLIGPGLVVVISSGAYMAGFHERWGAFYVRWGIGVIVLIGVALGAVMIPTAKRAEAIAERDLRAGETGAGKAGAIETGAGKAGAIETGAIGLSREYRALSGRLVAVGSLLSALILTTILFMTIGYPE